MSEQTATIDNETFIPSDDAVPTPTGSRDVWRIADGQIKTGREADGTERTKEKIVGRLRRIGIYHGASKATGEPYGQLEADIETAEGMTRVKTGITAKGSGALQPSVASLSFAEGLLDMAHNELIVVTANLASKPNKFGNFSTYANLYHLDANMRTKPAARLPKSDKSMDDRWADLEAQLRSHPAFADRPVSDSDEDGNATTHLSALCKYVAELGWPTPEQAPSEWLQLCQIFWEEPQPRASLSSFSDDEWGAARQAIIAEQAENPVMPDILSAAKQRLSGGAPKSEASPFGSTKPAGKTNSSAFGKEPNIFKNE